MKVLLYGILGKVAYDYMKSKKCPKATQDIVLNTKNRQKTIDQFVYGPPNPAQKSTWFWTKLAKKIWNMDNPSEQQLEDLKTMRCMNCSAFDISPRMKKCLPPDNQSDAYDLEGMDTGTFGYCWMHHFKCRSDRTCATWAGDKPIITDEDSYSWQAKYG